MEIKKIFIIAWDFENEVSWPASWVKNLVSGLERLWIKYTALKSYKLSELLKLMKIFSYKYIYMNGIVNYKIIYFLAKIFFGKKFIIWPNFLPNKNIISLQNCLYLSPCEWHKKYLQDAYNFDSPIEVLKFPIPYFDSIDVVWERKDITIYFKNLTKTNETEETIERKNVILSQIRKFLEEKNIKYNFIEYGSYKYDDWINTLKKSKIAIMITGTETQCIAKYEAMSLNVPMLNYKQSIRKWKETWVLINYGSSLPDIEKKIYWKDFENFEDFKKNYNYLLENLKKFHSKKYVEDNFLPHIIAKKLVNLFEKF